MHEMSCQSTIRGAEISQSSGSFFSPQSSFNLLGLVSKQGALHVHSALQVESESKSMNHNFRWRNSSFCIMHFISTPRMTLEMSTEKLLDEWNAFVYLYKHITRRWTVIKIYAHDFWFNHTYWSIDPLYLFSRIMIRRIPFHHVREVDRDTFSVPKFRVGGGGVRKHLRLKKHLRLNSHIILEHAQIEQEENIWKAKTQHALNYFRSKTEGELMIQG